MREIEHGIRPRLRQASANSNPTNSVLLETYGDKNTREARDRDAVDLEDNDDLN